MNKIKLSILVLAALALAALLTLFFTKREVYLPWTVPALPAKILISPARPDSAPVKVEKKAVEQSAAGRNMGVIKEPKAPGKPVKKRKRRVSRLQEPGEALGGGVQLDLADKTTGLMQQKK